jgi:hypothetical protein
LYGEQGCEDLDGFVSHGQRRHVQGHRTVKAESALAVAIQAHGIPRERGYVERVRGQDGLALNGAIQGMVLVLVHGAGQCDHHAFGEGAGRGGLEIEARMRDIVCGIQCVEVQPLRL